MCVFLVGMLTWEERSVRRAVEFLDPVVSGYLRDEVEFAWPHRPERRLPAKPLERWFGRPRPPDERRLAA